MGEKDRTEKMLEAYDDVFADIVNSLAFDGKDVISASDLQEQNPENHYVADGKIHGIERDIIKRWNHGNVRIAYIGFENQSEPDADMPLRVISYDGAGYRAQLLADNPDKNRYPVVTLVLYFGEKRWNRPVSLKERIKVPDVLNPFVNDYKINLYEMAYLTDEEMEKFKSDFHAVVEYFKNKRENRPYRPSGRKLKHPWETIRLISALARDRRIEEVYKEVEEEKGQVSNMCELIDAFIEQGEEQGIKKGIEQGIKQGSDEAETRIAKNMLLRKTMSYEDISELTGLSVEEVKELDTPVTA